MHRRKIVVVDDDQPNREGLRQLLERQGAQVREAADGPSALALIAADPPDVVLTNLQLPGMDGLTLLQRAHEEGVQCPFVVMSGVGTVETAVAAMKAGADFFLVKPTQEHVVTAVIEKMLHTRDLAEQTRSLRAQVHRQHRFESIIGDSPELEAVFDVVRRAAPTRANVLILGESGTGKELIAQALHQESTRADKPFIKLSCAALAETLLESELFGHERGAFTGAVSRTEGRFELADGGTLFLDEIGEISHSTQVKLLRVLQTREFERVGGTKTVHVDVRLVAATNKDLAAAVKEGRFREDLYYRLNVVNVTLPPLRARKSDIPMLANHFLRKFATAHGKEIHGLSAGTIAMLRKHDWPGNVRELENAIERAVVLARGHELQPEDLPALVRTPRAAGHGAEELLGTARFSDIEREAILSTLELAHGSTRKAAEVLGISIRKIQYRLKEYAAQGLLPPHAQHVRHGETAPQAHAH